MEPDTQLRDDGAVGRLPGLSAIAADALSLTVSEPPPPPYVSSQVMPSGMVTRLPPELYHEQHAGLLTHEPGSQASAHSACASPPPAAAATSFINKQGYAEAIMRACVQPGGVMGTLERGSQSASVGLQDVFVAQRVKLLDVSSFASDFELPAEHVEQLRRTGQLELLAPDVHRHSTAVFVSGRHRRSVMTLLSDASLRWVVILGSPGSGKSSALRVHLLAWAAASPAEREQLDFPVLVELKKYAYARDKHHASTLLQYMSGGGEARTPLDIAALQAMLQPLSGRRVLLLLDGLDEVFDVRLRAQVVEDVQRFVNEHRSAAVRVVLTSRIVGYSVRELQAYDFAHHVLQPLDRHEIDDFVRRWHAAVHTEAEAETRKGREARLAKALSETGLRQLASSPLLLSMICLVNHNRELPTQRASLYEACSRLLLERWKTEEAVQAAKDAAGMSITLFTRAHKEALLADLAWRMLDGKAAAIPAQGFIASMYSGLLSLWQRQQTVHTAVPVANLVPQDVLEAVVLEHVRRRQLQQVEPELVMQALITQLRERHHVICWLGGQSFAFVHRTFLDYYAALHLQLQFDAGRTSQAQLVQLFLQRAGGGWYDYGWVAVLQLLSAMLPPEVVYPCLEALAEDKQHLAARCLTQLQKRDEAAAAERVIRQQLEGAVRQDRGSFYIEPLAQLWPDDRTRTLLEEVAVRDEDITGAAVRELAAHWADDRTRAVLEQVARDTSGPKSVRAEALKQLSKRWKDSRTQAVLELIATSDASGLVAAAALVALDRNLCCSLEAMQTAAYWHGKGAAEGADQRVREAVWKWGGVVEFRALFR